MRCILSSLIVLALSSLPSFAACPATPACAAAALASPASPFLAAAPAVEPLAPAERLFYPVTGLRTDVPLEVHYLIAGRTLVTETFDLARQEAPRPAAERSRTPRGPQKAAPPDFVLPSGPGGPRGVERVTELLALRPELVRQLRQRERSGAAVLVEVYQGKVRLEAATLRELGDRFAPAAGRAVTPVVVPSRVSGEPREEAAPWTLASVPHKYLPNCNDCTTDTPCDEECGWDPGKGGPVTCGEFGVCASVCPCTDDAGLTYGGWYYYSTYYSGYSSCMKSNSWGSRWHDERVTVYRREVYQNTLQCPSCPSCVGCYIQQTQVSYQLAYATCWDESGSPCFSGSWACCSSLCGFGNDCNWTC